MLEVVVKTCKLRRSPPRSNGAEDRGVRLPSAHLAEESMVERPELFPDMVVGSLFLVASHTLLFPYAPVRG